MGLFGSRKKTYVSSVAYNMAGDINNRPNFLKTTVLGAIVDKGNISESIVGSYLKGPGMTFRAFARWARSSGYNSMIGLPEGSLRAGTSIDMNEVEEQVPHSPGSMVQLQSVKISEADYGYWVDKYVLDNHPERFGSEYTSDMDFATKQITITWEDTTTTSFIASDYVLDAEYLYASYSEVEPAHLDPLVESPVVTLASGEEYPDTTEWNLEIIEHDVYDLYYIWSREVYLGQTPGQDSTHSRHEFMHQWIHEGVRYYRLDTQVEYFNVSSGLQLFIYKRYSGNSVLDAMFQPPQNGGSFFPVIPFRLDNKFIGEDYLPSLYTMSKRGYKKATTGKFDKLVKDLKDNDDIGDIDYAYVVFGVSLNTKENASRMYIYNFFQNILKNYNTSGDSANEAWMQEWLQSQGMWEQWTAWKDAQSDPNNPLYGTAEPIRVPYRGQPTNSIRIASRANPAINYDITISWGSITEETGYTLLKPDAKKDEVWFSAINPNTREEVIWGQYGDKWDALVGGHVNNDSVYLNWQVNDNYYRRLHITGLRHKNLIYGGKSVEISMIEALSDMEESGFIIPLHEGIYKTMPLIHATQMTTACSYMLFNCYQVVKKKWYQTGIFAVVLIIIVAVVAYSTGGASLGASTGLLGTNAAVGSAILGAAASAMAVAIVGAIANAIAAMLLVKLITKVSVELFGEKWGAIIAAIASIIALNVGTSLQSGQGFTANFANLSMADKLLMFTRAAGDAYVGYVQGSISEMQQEYEQFLTQNKEEVATVQAAWNNVFGSGTGIDLDPARITESFGVTMESADAFLQRTLLTGADIAEMSMDMISEHVANTITSVLPI